MSRPIPHELPSAVKSELLNRIDDLNDQIRALEGLFQALDLLSGEFGMDRSGDRSQAYVTLVNAGKRYAEDARARSRTVQMLFLEPVYGGKHA